MSSEQTVEHRFQKEFVKPTTHIADLEKVIPPLENGDRLTRQEFERRYNAMPQIKKAELIEGVVYMPSPVRHKSHSRPHSQIITWLGAYCAATPGVDMVEKNGPKLIERCIESL